MIGRMTTATDQPESFQIPIEAAEAYEAAFVPAFFAQWAPVLCEAARVDAGPGACSTWRAGRASSPARRPTSSHPAAPWSGSTSTRRCSPSRAVSAPTSTGATATPDALPFGDREFDAVLCQMALMFFPDRAAALREMARVVRSGRLRRRAGAGPARRPARLRPVRRHAAARLAGPEAMSLLSTYFVCGDLDELSALVASAGLRVTTSRTLAGTYRAPSVDAMVTTEVESTPLVDRMSEVGHSGAPWRGPRAPAPLDRDRRPRGGPLRVGARGGPPRPPVTHDARQPGAAPPCSSSRHRSWARR